MKRMVVLIGLALAAIACAQNSSLPFEEQNLKNDQLYEAIKSLDLGQIKALLKSGANPNGVYANGWPMIFAALENSESSKGEQVFYMLVEAGADVNAVQPDQRWTPLHMAAATRIGPVWVVEYLIRRGAKIEAMMPGAGTPLHLATSWGRPDIVQVLVESGANLEARNERDPKTSYVPASAESGGKDGQEVIAEFYEPGFDGSGRTPLIGCVGMAEPDIAIKIAKILLDSGADISARDSVGRTVLHEAIQAHNDGLAEYLVSRGAHVDAKTNNGFTPLHLAVRPNMYGAMNLPCVELLLKHGADPNASDKNGATPLALLKSAYRAAVKRYENSPSMPAQNRKFALDLMAKQKSEIETVLIRLGAKENVSSGSSWKLFWGLLIGTTILVATRLYRKSANSKH